MDAFSRHEALDRAHLIAEIFDTHLLHHAYIQATPELARQCEQIAEALGALYQAIGQQEEDRRMK